MHIKYLEERKRANGRTIWVVNPPKYVREAIGADYEQFEDRSEAINRAGTIAQAYIDHKRGLKTDIRIPSETVDGVFAFYKTTNEYAKLKENSRKYYRLMFNTASATRLGQSNVLFGEMLARSVNTTHADKLFQTAKEAVSEHRAVGVIKVLRKVWNVAKRHGKVQVNPFEKMGLAGLEPRIVLWEPDQVDTFIAKADEMGLWSIGTIALLAYHLCQRPGDMRQLRWSHYDGHAFTFMQEKTGVKVEIPASPAVIERLKDRRVGVNNPDEFIALCETTLQGYDRFLYTKYARKVRKAAGLPDDLQIRDLRRTGATEMAEAGATEDELRSVTGHQSRDVLSIYVRPTRKLAASGVFKRFAK